MQAQQGGVKFLFHRPAFFASGEIPASYAPTFSLVFQPEPAENSWLAASSRDIMHARMLSSQEETAEFSQKITNDILIPIHESSTRPIAA
jgi:hypothetical protein